MLTELIWVVGEYVFYVLATTIIAGIWAFFSMRPA